MPPTYGKIEEFDEGKETFIQYTKRLEFYFKANGIEGEEVDEKKRAIFLTVVGPTTFNLLCDLLSPAEPEDKAYDEIIGLLKAHVNPPPSEIVERFKFNSRNRKEGETVAEFVKELRGLAKHCNYGTTLDKMLRDRLVAGINNSTIQHKLFGEPAAGLTFDRALAITKAEEAAAKNTLDVRAMIQFGQKPEGIYKVDKHPCFRCGRDSHSADDCPCKEFECHYCKKRGHIARVCKAKPRGNQLTQNRTSPREVKRETKYTRYVAEQLDEEPAQSMFTVKAHNVPKETNAPPIKVVLKLAGMPVQMEVDTGAAISLISEHTYKDLWPGGCSPLEESKVRLKTYTGETLGVLGEIMVEVEYGEQQPGKLPLVVAKGNGPDLLGRNWLQSIKLNWQAIHGINRISSTTLDALITKHEAIFRDELGTLKGTKAKIHVLPDAIPKFCKARTVPFAMRDKVEAELCRLQELGVIEPVEFSDWAAPIVPVLKADGTSVRICGDFKMTVNKSSAVEKYPIPKVEDLFVKLGGGEKFTKLDLRQAYHQLELDEESKELVTINTHSGLYRYNRLPFGVASAPALFQRTMELILKDIPGVVVYIDDILVTGSNDKKHLERLEQVFQRVGGAGLRFRKDKCAFMQPSVEYLGHIIDEDGLHPTPYRVRAVLEAPAPCTVTELKSFLGLLSYYCKFLPKSSECLAPLHKLLHAAVPWRWSETEQEAFDASKQLLASSQLLIHFDPNKPVILATDASSFGLGAVLAHELPDGSERPIAFASRTMSKAEKNYSQLEKEGLSIVFGLKKFRNYLLGSKFRLYTDHKPLVSLFGQENPVPPLAASRIQRWALILAAYDYEIYHKSTQNHGNADGLSRLPLPEVPVDQPEETVLFMELAAPPLSAAQLQVWTRNDPILAQVYAFTANGWPEQPSDNALLKPYEIRKTELTIIDGILLWGARVVIPNRGREKVLEELHEAHPGISRMKALARSYVWWPQIDKSIETVVNTCGSCQANRPTPPVVPLHPWEWPTRPWSRLHVDHAGPFMGHMYLIVVDAHSKWLEVKRVSATTSAMTIATLREIFATHGLPEQLVSDNGPAFTSKDFENFMTQNGIKHKKSAPFHPATNGLAERAVQSFKMGIKKLPTGTIDEKIARFLLAYRRTPHTTTGRPPAELLMGRQIRCRLDLLKPNLETKVRDRQGKMKDNHDQGARERSFDDGDMVYAQNYAPGNKWIPGQITQHSGTLSCVVQLEDGRMWRRHYDQLRPSHKDQTVFHEVRVEPVVPQLPNLEPGEDIPFPEALPESIPDQTSMTRGMPTEIDIPALRRSSRTVKAPDRLNL